MSWLRDSNSKKGYWKSILLVSSSILFLNDKQNGSRLADVASKTFQCLKITEWEERFSSNYPPDEHYFIGYAENACVEVYDADDERMPDYRFRIAIENSARRKGADKIQTDPPKVAELLADVGMKVFIPFGTWQMKDWDGDGEIYG